MTLPLHSASGALFHWSYSILLPLHLELCVTDATLFCLPLHVIICLLFVSQLLIDMLICFWCEALLSICRVLCSFSIWISTVSGALCCLPLHVTLCLFFASQLLLDLLICCICFWCEALLPIYPVLYYFNIWITTVSACDALLALCICALVHLTIYCLFISCSPVC